MEISNCLYRGFVAFSNFVSEVRDNFFIEIDGDEPRAPLNPTRVKHLEDPVKVVAQWDGSTNAKVRIARFLRDPQADSIDLRNCELESLPDIFSHPQVKGRLKNLDLSGNYFKEFPTEICSLSSLRVLNLSSNGLTTLVPEIRRLKSLVLLYLVDNKLTTLPVEICELESLEGVNVSHNGITKLPHEITNNKSFSVTLFDLDY